MYKRIKYNKANSLGHQQSPRMSSAGRSARSASQPANSAESAHRQASLPLRLRLIRGDYATKEGALID